MQYNIYHKTHICFLDKEEDNMRKVRMSDVQRKKLEVMGFEFDDDHSQMIISRNSETKAFLQYQYGKDEIFIQANERTYYVKNVRIASYFNGDMILLVNRCRDEIIIS